MKIEDFKKLVDAATMGPWTQGGIADPRGMHPTTWIYGARQSPLDQSGPEIARNVSLADAEFIIAARILMPLLLDVAIKAKKLIYRARMENVPETYLGALSMALERLEETEQTAGWDGGAGALMLQDTDERAAFMNAD